MLESQRALFDLPDDVVWLNCAQHSPALKRVTAAAHAGLERKRHPWRLGPAQYQDDVAELRRLFGRVIGATARDIAIVPSVSYAISLAAANLPLPEGRYALVLEEQFPSNVYPWRRAAARHGGSVKTVARPAGGDWTEAVLAALDERCAVLALPNHHWMDGGRLDLPVLAAAARSLGAAVVIDATQTIGAVPFDLAAVQPDFLAAGAYKWLLGPYAFGFLYAAPHRQQGRPLEEAWSSRQGAFDGGRLTDYQDGYYPDARRYDVGERGDYIAVPMAAAALRQILDWQVPAIAQSIQPLVEALTRGAEALGLEPTPAAQRAPHFLGLRAERPLRADLLERLREEKIYLSQRGDSLRVSPHLYNDMAEVARLLESLARLL